jgi:hypothetical protein
MNEMRSTAQGMRLPDAAHTDEPWRIHELTRDFRLEDVWLLPASGDTDEFPRLVGVFTSGTTSDHPSGLTGVLIAIRAALGKLFGWDRPGAGLGSRVSPLRERLPEDLRETSPPAFKGRAFSSLYLLEHEFAAELANQTVHAVLHLGWVADGAGGYRGQMAILVKPHGFAGKAYMAAIRPFRYTIVYPDFMRRIGRAWRAGAGGPEIAA